MEKTGPYLSNGETVPNSLQVQRTHKNPVPVTRTGATRQPTALHSTSAVPSHSLRTATQMPPAAGNRVGGLPIGLTQSFREQPLSTPPPSNNPPPTPSSGIRAAALPAGLTLSMREQSTREQPPITSSTPPNNPPPATPSATTGGNRAGLPLSLSQSAREQPPPPSIISSPPPNTNPPPTPSITLLIPDKENNISNQTPSVENNRLSPRSPRSPRSSRVIQAEPNHVLSPPVRANTEVPRSEKLSPRSTSTETTPIRLNQTLTENTNTPAGPKDLLDDFQLITDNPLSRTITQGLRNLSSTNVPNYKPERSDLANLTDPETIKTEDDFDKKYPLTQITWESQLSKREKITQEIYLTERTYIKQLQKSILLYKYKLVYNYPAGFPPTLLKLEKMFSYIAEVLSVNNMLYNQLTECFKQGPQYDKIGGVFCKLAPFFKLYTQYTDGYNDVMNVIKDESSQSESFKNILDYAVNHPLAKNLDLGAFLILPVQRIPRYVLLITDLIKNTDLNHPDYASLSEALRLMKIVADHIEESMIAAENREKCLAIQNSFLILKDVKILEPGRRFIKEGNLIKQCRRDRKERKFYLFTDCLIYAFETGLDGKYIFSGSIPLSVLFVVDIADEAALDYKNTLKFEAKGKSFFVFAATPEDKQSWYTAINNATKSLEEKKQTLKIKDQPEEDSFMVEKAPTWVPDAQAYNCACCDQLFRFGVRKHHCRCCGQVVCGPCSRSRMIVKAVSQTPERVCRKCYKKN